MPLLHETELPATIVSVADWVRSVGPQVPCVTDGCEVIVTRRLLCRNECAVAKFARPKTATKHEIQKLRRFTINTLLPPDWIEKGSLTLASVVMSRSDLMTKA